MVSLSKRAGPYGELKTKEMSGAKVEGWGVRKKSRRKKNANPHPFPLFHSTLFLLDRKISSELWSTTH
jgi:hypothetical protein